MKLHSKEPVKKIDPCIHSRCIMIIKTLKTAENSMEKIEAVYCFTVCDIQYLLNAFHRMYGQTTPTHWGHLYTKHLTRQILTSLTGIIHTPRASSWA